MEKKLLVRTPVTNDGISPVYDADKKPVYKESIMELAAKKVLESENAKRPPVLRHEFGVIEIQDEATGKSVAELTKKLEALENQKATQSLQERIAELEKEIDGNKTTGQLTPLAGGGALEVKLSKDGKADEAIEAVSVMGSVEDIKEFIGGEERKTVIEAANKRIAELQPA